MCFWIMGASVRESEEQEDEGSAGSIKRNGISLDCTENREVQRPAWAQQSDAQVRQ